jgi:hypothetical protein
MLDAAAGDAVVDTRVVSFHGLSLILDAEVRVVGMGK